MLSKLFGYGDTTSAKLVFRQSLQRLHSESIQANDTAFWQRFLTTFGAASEVSSLMPAEVLRLAMLQRPENIVVLIQFLSQHIFKLIADPAFPATSSSTAWLPTNMTTDDKSREMLNCLRVLTRLWPLLFEATTPPTSIEERSTRDVDWADRLLWSRQPVENGHDAEEGQFVIEDEDDSGLSFASLASDASGHSHKELGPSLGHKLLVILLT